MNTKTLQDEKADIKKALRHPFSEGAIWQPLAIPWFEKWKTYVNYDDEVPEPRAKELIDSLHPGEIDNNSLQGSFGDEMRRDAVEGRDYVLMPTSYVNKLLEKYGGGPSYPRKVLNVGATYNPIYQVNLFPVRIEVYFCDKHQPTPVQTDDRFKRRYFNKNMSLENVAEDLHRIFQLSSATSSIRYWLRDTPPDVSGRNKEGRGRMLTCDVVDFDNDWRFVRSDKHRNIQEVLGDRDCIELIIESTTFRNPKDSDWPRFQQLEAWKETLQVGDMVDVRDRKGKFYAAKILSIDESRNLQVHFLGWAENSDEKIMATEINARVQPLHSHSFDRTTWEEGNKLDVCLTEVNQQAVWVTGTIISVDPLNDRIEVLVDAKDKADAMKKVTSTAAAEIPTSTTATSIYDDIDDDFAGDDEKKKKTSTIATSSSFVSVATIAAAVEDVTTPTPQEDVSLRSWHDVYADTIAPQYTHTPAVRTYNSSSSYGYSSGYTMSLYNGYGSSSSYDRHTKGTPPVAGAIGLQNLGNTCFMNSILQCLSNTQCLTEMFTSNVYKEQINYDNPLGHAGKIALTYGKLMKDVWSGAYTKIVPREFKTVIGEYRPQFAGYEQQDSQEMMSCLLDGLHEDLNRIYKKPYTQKIESKGRPDELIASESWRRFLLRNDSLIVEKFFGLQKSHVTCKKCGKESVTFDPYAALSLPIPIRNTRTIHVVVQLLPHSSPPVRVALEVELTAPMSELKKILLDKLFALQLLTKPEDPATAPLSTQLLPTASNSNNSNTNSVSSKQSTEESFELVDKKDAAVEATDDADSHQNNSNGGYHMVVDGDEGALPSDVSSPATAPAQKTKKNSSNATKPKTVYDAFHFHFGMLYGTRPTTVFKNYNSSEARNTAIQAFVNKLDTLMAFQLDYDLPEFKPMASQSYYSSSYNTYNSRNYNKGLDDIDGEDAENTEPKYFGFDLSIATRSVEARLNTTSERTELASYPHRLSFPLGDMTTNAEVHRVVREVLSRLVPADSLLRAEDAVGHWPYELAVTSAYGTTTHRTIRDNDDPFQPLKENSSEILVAYFHPSAVKDRLVDLSKVREVVDVETKRGVDDDDAAMESNSSGLDDDDTLDDDEYYPATTYQLQLQKKNKASGVTNNPSTNKKVKRGISIYDCLDKFVEREQLADTETVYCSRCKDMLAPIKKMDIWTAPDILLLHLKRFQFLTGQYMVLREKITEVVDFPIEGLDLSRYVQGPVSAEAPPIYDLYAVSHHMGGLGGGHYTATAKNFINNQWYNFNDSSVSPADPASAVTATAYVLFYKRRTGSLKWAGAVPHPVGLPDEADD